MWIIEKSESNSDDCKKIIDALTKADADFLVSNKKEGTSTFYDVGGFHYGSRNFVDRYNKGSLNKYNVHNIKDVYKGDALNNSYNTRDKMHLERHIASLPLSNGFYVAPVMIGQDQGIIINRQSVFEVYYKTIVLKYPETTEFIIAPAKRIEKEYAACIIDNRIVSCSFRDIGNRYCWFLMDQYDLPTITEIQYLSSLWDESEPFIIKVALVEGDFYVSSVKPLSISKLYALNVQEIINKVLT